MPDQGEARSSLRQAALAEQGMRAAAGLEVLTGLGLVAMPSLLARLLFGAALDATGEATGRIAGIVMLCLALGCWPRAGAADRAPALLPLIVLSWLVAAFLAMTGLAGAPAGLLLWPAAVLHLALAGLLTWAWASAPAPS